MTRIQKPTQAQLARIAALELCFGGVRQMGLPKDLTRWQAEAYLKVLQWKVTPYEERGKQCL